MKRRSKINDTYSVPEGLSKKEVKAIAMKATWRPERFLWSKEGDFEVSPALESWQPHYYRLFATRDGVTHSLFVHRKGSAPPGPLEVHVVHGRCEQLGPDTPSKFFKFADLWS